MYNGRVVQFLARFSVQFIRHQQAYQNTSVQSLCNVLPENACLWETFSNRWEIERVDTIVRTCIAWFVLFWYSQLSKKCPPLKSVPFCFVFLLVDVLQKGLDKHNFYRRIHKSPALILSSQLNSDAQKTAEKSAAQGRLVHTDDSELGDQGENLGKLCASDETPEEIITKVVERWWVDYDQILSDRPGKILWRFP